MKINSRSPRYNSSHTPNYTFLATICTLSTCIIWITHFSSKIWPMVVASGIIITLILYTFHKLDDFKHDKVLLLGEIEALKRRIKYSDDEFEHQKDKSLWQLGYYLDSFWHETEYKQYILALAYILRLCNQYKCIRGTMILEVMDAAGEGPYEYVREVFGESYNSLLNLPIDYIPWLTIDLSYAMQRGGERYIHKKVAEIEGKYILKQLEEHSNNN